MALFSPPGENMVSEQALQVQENHEARQQQRRHGGGSSPQHQLHLAMLAQPAPALGGLHGQQGSPRAPQRLHEQLWTLVPEPPASPGRHAKASDDVSCIVLEAALLLLAS